MKGTQHRDVLGTAPVRKTTVKMERALASQTAVTRWAVRARCGPLGRLLDKFGYTGGVFEARPGSGSDDPWARSRRPAASAEQHGVQGGIGLPADEPAGETPGERTRRRTLPLKLAGSLGSVGYKDKAMFEDKLATTEFQYDGVKGGAAWKTKVERYMVYKAHVLNEFLEWAKAQDNDDINNDLVVRACLAKLSEEQATAVNSQIWFPKLMFAGHG